MIDNNIEQQTFWNERWLNNQTGWDIGYASPAIVDYMRTYPDRNARILIPGCGNAYEAQALVEMGFTNITLIDISPIAIENIKNRYKSFPQIRVWCHDFFKIDETFDLVLEQTFFCAIPKSWRANYVQKMNEILAPNGKVAGLMFHVEFEKEGPPFGGSIHEYQQLFSSAFHVLKMEHTEKSIQPRMGSELFVEFQKKG